MVAQGLPAAGGHDRKHVFPGQDAGDDGLLVPAEGLKTEDRAKGMQYSGIVGGQVNVHEDHSSINYNKMRDCCRKRHRNDHYRP